MVRAPRRLWAACVLSMWLTSPSTAVANGNVSHQWVTRTAAAQTPQGGSLYALVNDEALVGARDTGTRFPDWGYTPSATSDERIAGESAHWEPVQEGYRQFILANYAPPWSDEARLHLAFYLGMNAHGMGDQTYDSMFFERSRFYEPGNHDLFDQDTDVMWAATAGPGDVPPSWIPVAPLLELFDTVAGVSIDGTSMATEVGVVGIAIGLVNAIAAQPKQVAAAEANFPWAAAHDHDATTPGNPGLAAEVVRRYWRSNWALLHGDPIPRPVLWTHPADGAALHPTDAASIESWISIVFARGLAASELSAEQFHVVDTNGVELPIAVHLFYGDQSHVVHLKPGGDLLADETYVVTVDPGTQTIHGEALQGWSFTFSTGKRGPAPLNDDSFWDEPDPYGEDPAGGTTGGSTGGTTGGTTGEPAPLDESGVDDSDANGSTGASVTGTGGPTAAPQGESSGGCGCRNTGGGRGALTLFVLLVLATSRSRKRAASASVEG